MGGTPTHSYQSATPSFIRVPEGDPSVRRRLHAEHTSRCWNKGGSPPSCQERWGGVPGFTKVGRERGCPRSRVDLRSPQPITEIDRSDQFFCGAGGRGGYRFFGGRGYPRAFSGIVRSRPEIFKEKSGWLYVTSCRALETNPEDGGCRPHTPTSEECRRPRRGAPAADQWNGC